ncbi:MAG TPA: hypothetical protein VK608_04250, partial [Edaphobacter sp.]|nr:hypothetical protein [Edaphobacter sp.]
PHHLVPKIFVQQMDRTDSKKEEKNRLAELEQTNQQQSTIVDACALRTFLHLYQSLLAREFVLHRSDLSVDGSSRQLSTPLITASTIRHIGSIAQQETGCISSPLHPPELPYECLANTCSIILVR